MCWSPRDGLSLFLHPSGYAGPPTAVLREAGANGLLAEPGGTLLLADSGSRLVARMDLASKRKTALAERFEGRRFNSPNDLARRADGTIFFTDPPYGLAGIQDSPARELPFSGVYRLDADGSVHLLDDTLAFPNGIADDTHFSELGARAMANLVAQELKGLKVPVAEKVLADRPDLTRSKPLGSAACH